MIPGSVGMNGYNIPSLPTASTQNHPIWNIVQGNLNASSVSEVENILKKDGCVIDMEMDQWKPLHYLCDNSNIANYQEIIELFIKAKASCKVLDGYGWTPLHVLCKNKSGNLVQSIKTMLEADADPNLHTKDDKRTALHILCNNEEIQKGSFEALISKMTDVNSLDEDGSIPLHYLCSNPSFDECLLASAKRKCLNPNIQNRFKATPFHNYCQSSSISESMLSTFFSMGADPNIPDNVGSSPFYYFCENSCLSKALLDIFLIKSKANILISNMSGKRPYDVIIRSGNKECIQIAKKYLPATLTTQGSGTVEIGGEDTSFTTGILHDTLTQWNGTLPPMDKVFYTTICCEASFEKEYETLQQLSYQVHEDPSNKKNLQQWQSCLSSWRKCILNVFISLVDPTTWEEQENAFQRKIPGDVVKVKSKVESVWKNYPENNHRRARLEALKDLF